MTPAHAQQPPAPWPEPARICARCRLILPATGDCTCTTRDARIIGLGSLVSGHQLATMSVLDVDTRLRQRRRPSAPWLRTDRRIVLRATSVRARGVARGAGVMAVTRGLPVQALAMGLELLDHYHGQALTALRLCATVGFTLEGGAEPIDVPPGAVELLIPATNMSVVAARTELYSALTAGGAFVRRVDGHMASLSLVRPDEEVTVHAAAFVRELDAHADTGGYRDAPASRLVAQGPIAIEVGQSPLRRWLRRARGR